MTPDPDGLDRRALTASEITATLDAVHGVGGALPEPFQTGPDAWLITDLTDGRLTGRRRPDDSWIRSDQAFPDFSPTPPVPEETWRLQQLRLFTANCEIIITGGATPTGWIHSTTPGTRRGPLAPRTRKFLLGPRYGTPTHREGFSLIENTTAGTRLILPVRWQVPTATDHGTAGTWLHICEHFNQDQRTGAVGVTHTRYTALTTDAATPEPEVHP